jgi:hypothetical protein
MVGWYPSVRIRESELRLQAMIVAVGHDLQAPLEFRPEPDAAPDLDP